MNELMEKFEAARFGKAAAAARGMTPELRAIRRSVEQSLRKMEEQKQEAQEALDYAQRLSAERPGMPWHVKTLLQAGTGAGTAAAGSELLARAPRGLHKMLFKLTPEKIREAAQVAGIKQTKEMIEKGTDFGSIGAQHVANIFGGGRTARYGSKIPIIGRLFRQVGEEGLPTGEAVSAAAKAQASPAIRKSFRESVRHAAKTKGGLAKTLGGGALAGVALMQVLPWIIKQIRYAGVGGPGAVEAKQEALRALQRSEGYRRFVEAQLEQLEKAKSPEQIRRVPIEPFARQVPFITPATSR